MSKKNKHIIQYLNYYVELDHSPNFAVLLSGEWGCGKTWLYKKFEDSRTDHKFLYVSLYGITNLNEIENLFFTKLHPKLSSKKFLLAGSIGRNILKGTLKIDVNGDSKDDLTINPTLKDISLKSILTKTEGYILVFDDIERTKLKICDVLGYINSYIEHNDYKAILIANEEQIKDKEYENIKEKLIGKTFVVQSELDNAFDNFMDNSTLKSARDFYNGNRKLICKLFEESGYNNLRFLKQTILDFDRLHETLNDEILNNSEVMTHLFTYFFILTFESRKGAINNDDFNIDFVQKYLLKEKKEELKIEQVSKKYSNFRINDSILTLPYWGEIILKNILNRDQVNKNIMSSRYFKYKNTPTWKKLWHSFDLDKVDFYKYTEDLFQELKKSKIIETGEILHTASILLWCSKNKFIEQSQTKIQKIIKNYISHLYKHKKLHPKMGQSNWGAAESWDGLGFHSKNDPLFEEIIEYLDLYRDKMFLSTIDKHIDELFDNLVKNTQLFYEKLSVNENDTAIYNRTIILNHFDIERFCSLVTQLSMKNRKLVFYMLDNRFARNLHNDYFIKELEWFKLFYIELNKSINQIENNFEKYQYSSLSKQYLDPINISIIKKLGR